ncbi:transposase [Paenibacillus larvae subsp. larvae DSM 25430]|uniref:Transposase n=2 Tax=Paenibacillus larvae subsp. larvae TaxID=147375 RepID=V9WAK9_9BACL|nr:transposase [Paenibacillus larvae subsp. larvae DSM 25430]
MSDMTKKYDKEFKLQSVRLIQEEGKSVAQVAREMGLHENTLYRWIAEFKNAGNQPSPIRFPYKYVSMQE